MKLEYTLTSDQYAEYQYFMSFHNAAVQRKCLKLSLFISATAAALIFLLVQELWKSVLASVFAIAAIMMLFPRFFWQESERRIKRVINQKAVVFNPIQLEISKTITVKNGGKEYTFRKEAIQSIAYTKNLCLVYYQEAESGNTLIIPLSEVKLPAAEFDKLLKGEHA